jgi:hypothetical protein
MVIPGRVGGTATLLPDGTVLVAGGEGTDGPDPLTSAELFDPASGTWRATGSMLEGRYFQSATLLLDGTLLVTGGYPRAGLDPALISAELYDPITGTWTATADMTAARVGHTATLLADGRLLVAGGLECCAAGVVGDRLASAELYDPDTGTWTATADMTHARDGHTATLLPDGWVLVAGGGGRSAELFDPVAETWIATEDLTEPYYGHTATLLPDGTVLVAGGDAPSGPGARAWPHAALFDPVTGTWDATQAMITPRLGHTATLLPDGRVLVLGGSVGGGAASPLLREAELYDPDTGRWAAIGDMIDARSGHTATLLPDGRVLAAGGYGGQDPSTFLSSAELYDPGSGS